MLNKYFHSKFLFGNVFDFPSKELGSNPSPGAQRTYYYVPGVKKNNKMDAVFAGIFTANKLSLFKIG